MNGISTKIIADTVNAYGNRVTTMQLTYPRFIHSEFMTHRAFSRNSSSSRAIPVSKMIEQVLKNPAMPVHWGKNQAGMQADETLTPENEARAVELWNAAAASAASFAEDLCNLGLHKQVANRILEPFQFMHTVVTATDWGNFFDLRCHPDAQPEIQALANLMRDALENSVPTERRYHLPYITEDEITEAAAKYETTHDMYQDLARISAARCARVSYLKHDGQKPSREDDLKLFERLVGSRPIHASPTEHQAYFKFTSRPSNFIGWVQFRTDVENKLDAH